MPLEFGDASRGDAAAADGSELHLTVPESIRLLGLCFIKDPRYTYVSSGSSAPHKDSAIDHIKVTENKAHKSRKWYVGLQSTKTYGLRTNIIGILTNHADCDVYVIPLDIKNNYEGQATSTPYTAFALIKRSNATKERDSFYITYVGFHNNHISKGTMAMIQSAFNDRSKSETNKLELLNFVTETLELKGKLNTAVKSTDSPFHALLMALTKEYEHLDNDNITPLCADSLKQVINNPPLAKAYLHVTSRTWPDSAFVETLAILSGQQDTSYESFNEFNKSGKAHLTTSDLDNYLQMNNWKTFLCMIVVLQRRGYIMIDANQCRNQAIVFLRHPSLNKTIALKTEKPSNDGSIPRIQKIVSQHQQHNPDNIYAINFADNFIAYIIVLTQEITEKKVSADEVRTIITSHMPRDIEVSNDEIAWLSPLPAGKLHPHATVAPVVFEPEEKNAGKIVHSNIAGLSLAEHLALYPSPQTKFLLAQQLYFANKTMRNILKSYLNDHSQYHQCITRPQADGLDLVINCVELAGESITEENRQHLIKLAEKLKRETNELVAELPQTIDTLVARLQSSVKETCEAEEGVAGAAAIYETLEENTADATTSIEAQQQRLSLLLSRLISSSANIEMIITGARNDILDDTIALLTELKGKLNDNNRKQIQLLITTLQAEKEQPRQDNATTLLKKLAIPQTKGKEPYSQTEIDKYTKLTGDEFKKAKVTRHHNPYSAVSVINRVAPLASEQSDATVGDLYFNMVLGCLALNGYSLSEAKRNDFVASKGQGLDECKIRTAYFTTFEAFLANKPELQTYGHYYAVVSHPDCILPLLIHCHNNKMCVYHSNNDDETVDDIIRSTQDNGTFKANFKAIKSVTGVTVDPSMTLSNWYKSWMSTVTFNPNNKDGFPQPPASAKIQIIADAEEIFEISYDEVKSLLANLSTIWLLLYDFHGANWPIVICRNPGDETNLIIYCHPHDMPELQQTYPDIKVFYEKFPGALALKEKANTRRYTPTSIQFAVMQMHRTPSFDSMFCNTFTASLPGSSSFPHNNHCYATIAFNCGQYARKHRKLQQTAHFNFPLQLSNKLTLTPQQANKHKLFCDSSEGYTCAGLLPVQRVILEGLVIGMAFAIPGYQEYVIVMMPASKKQTHEHPITVEKLFEVLNAYLDGHGKININNCSIIAASYQRDSFETIVHLPAIPRWKTFSNDDIRKEFGLACRLYMGLKHDDASNTVIFNPRIVLFPEDKARTQPKLNITTPLCNTGALLHTQASLSPRKKAGFFARRPSTAEAASLSPMSPHRDSDASAAASVPITSTNEPLKSIYTFEM